jgi:exosortase
MRRTGVAAERKGRAWKAGDLVVLAALVALGTWTQHQALWDILTRAAGDEEHSYIFLVPIVAAWLLWLRRSRLRCVRMRPSLVGPAAVAAGFLASWLGLEHGVEVLWHGGAGLVLVGCLFTMTGLEPLRQFGAVFAVLIFALPVPGTIRGETAGPLQSLATGVTHELLELFGVEATRMGKVLVINGEQIAVGEACNGMRMVFAFFLVMYAFAFGTALRAGTRALLLVLSPVAALLCNVVRLVPTSLIYGYGSVSGAEWFHEISGWLMLPVALVMLIMLLRLLRWLELPVMPFRLAVQ